MTQIDTKTLLDEIAGIAITTNGKPHIPRTLRDELVTHLLDTAPLSREEREDEIRKAGWVPNSKYISQFNHPNHTGWIDIEQDCEKPMFHFASVTIPLSSVTRRLLRDCGVIA